MSNSERCIQAYQDQLNLREDLEPIWQIAFSLAAIADHLEHGGITLVFADRPPKDSD